MGKNENAWFGGFKRLIADESLGEYLGLVVGSANKAVHIMDIADIDLDLNLSADSYPTLYIHGSASATEYIKMYTDSTDAHIAVTGANLDINAVTSVAVQISGSDALVFNATTLNMGSLTITNAGDITTLALGDVTLGAGGKLKGAATIIDSTGSLTLQIGGVGLLAIDDSNPAVDAIAAADDTAGQPVYIEAQQGGTGTTAASDGASIYILGGAGGTILGSGGAGTGAGTGASGGSIKLSAGTASLGTAAADGTGGNIILEPGDVIGSGVKGYVEILGTASWTAGSLGTVVIALTGPVGSLLCTEWLRVQDNAGTIAYIPAFLEK